MSGTPPEECFVADLERLETLDDPRERDALALRLADLRRPELKPVLVRLINRLAQTKHRQTLVYCLGHLDCSDQLCLLVQLIATGNFGVAMEAAMIVNDIETADWQEIDEALTLTKEALARPADTDWRHNALAELKEELEAFQ